MSDRLCGLDRTAILINLAASIFYAQALLDQEDETHFEALTPYLKHQYVALAALIVDSFVPAAVTRPSTGADVHHSIQETSMGDGSPGRLFEHVAAVARSEAARVLAFRNIDPRD